MAVGSGAGRCARRRRAPFRHIPPGEATRPERLARSEKIKTPGQRLDLTGRGQKTRARSRHEDFSLDTRECGFLPFQTRRVARAPAHRSGASRSATRGSDPRLASTRRGGGAGRANDCGSFMKSTMAAGTGLRCAEFHSDPRSDDPGPRCGHTLTCVPAEGDGQRLIVFGGATALEGDGPNGSTSGIRASPPRTSIPPPRPRFLDLAQSRSPI